jgi:hypothetical protein
MTETLAQIEGLERGPAGNTSLAAAFSIAAELDKDQIIVVQETEYTGAGKHIQPQLSFARDNGIEIKFGNPRDEVPGKSIILPADPSKIAAHELDLDKIRKSFIKNAIKFNEDKPLTEDDVAYLAEETRLTAERVREIDTEIRENL